MLQQILTAFRALPTKPTLAEANRRLVAATTDHRDAEQECQAAQSAEASALAEGAGAPKLAKLRTAARAADDRLSTAAAVVDAQKVIVAELQEEERVTKLNAQVDEVDAMLEERIGIMASIDQHIAGIGSDVTRAIALQEQIFSKWSIGGGRGPEDFPDSFRIHVLEAVLALKLAAATDGRVNSRLGVTVDQARQAKGLRERAEDERERIVASLRAQLARKPSA